MRVKIFVKYLEIHFRKNDISFFDETEVEI